MAHAEQPGPVAGGLKYQPPPDSQSGYRVSPDRIRGCEDVPRPILLVLAPDHVGQTAHEQPVLYWYLSRATSYPVAVTLIDLDSPIPLLKTRLGPPLQPGVLRVRLADYGVRLVPGTLYQWFVALMPDTMHACEEVLSGGVIVRALAADKRPPSKAAAPQRYAEAGLWYDAISAISDLIEAAPHDATLRQQRAALLEQVGLLEAAAHDLRR
jgi:hypothetical protein